MLNETHNWRYSQTKIFFQIYLLEQDLVTVLLNCWLHFWDLMFDQVDNQFFADLVGSCCVNIKSWSRGISWKSAEVSPLWLLLQLKYYWMLGPLLQPITCKCHCWMGNCISSLEWYFSKLVDHSLPPTEDANKQKLVSEWE